jgi:hypothetical protein
MMQSETIGKLAAALSKAQGEMAAAPKDAKGNFGRYSTLDSLWDVARPVLAKHELALVQSTDITPDGRCVLVSVLTHSSGEWISGVYPVEPVQKTPQGMGSAMTYARRYSFSAMIGLTSDEDDDGNLASRGAGANGKAAAPNGRPAVPNGKAAVPAGAKAAAAPGKVNVPTPESFATMPEMSPDGPQPDEDLSSLFDSDGWEAEWTTNVHYTAAKAWGERLVGAETVAALWPTVFKAKAAHKPENAMSFLIAWREAINSAA